MRVLVREQPRSLALATETHVLVFRYFFHSQSGQLERPKCIVEFAPVEKCDLKQYKPLSNQECHGFLGIINMDHDVYLCTITRKAQVASPRPGETIFRIYGVEFHCLTKPDWDFVNLDSNGYPMENTDSTSTFEDRTRSAAYVEHPCNNIKKLLSNGSFYYSTDFDLTSVLQNR